ncbi:TMEM165/GDT1 family protein [archaeon]|nr:MAG: TMEM165/GDT1 family protein [archaeon]
MCRNHTPCTIHHTPCVMQYAGGLLGHAFCTGLAVLGGRMLAARISERTVAVIGGVLFLFFGVTSFLYGPE